MRAILRVGLIRSATIVLTDLTTSLHKDDKRLMRGMGDRNG
jgi:hypothetical protein